MPDCPTAPRARVQPAGAQPATRTAATRAATIAQVQGALTKHPAAFPEIVVTSSEKGEGIETLRAIIATLE